MKYKEQWVMNLYKVLIVDDESIIRNGLYNMIPWSNLGVSDVLTASCAKEALKIAQDTKPDIMLTDICMPEMDGLEMTKIMLEKVPDLKVIVLTGYDDFKYAQKSCSLGVKDFILKPVDESSLIKCIKLQIDNIQSEIQSAVENSIMSRKRMIENQKEFEKSLIKLTEKAVDNAYAIEVPEGIKFEDNCEYQVAVLTPEISENSIWNQHRNLLMMSVKSFFIDMVDAKNSGWTFQNSDGDIVVIFYVDKKSENAEEQISKLQEIINVEFDVEMEVGIGPVVPNMSRIKYSYEKARGKCGINNTKLGNEYQSKKDKLLVLKEKVLSSFHDTEAAKEYLKKYINEVKISGVTKSIAEQKFYDLASAFYWEYLKTTGNPADGRLETLITTLQTNDLENCCVFTEMFIVKLMYTNKKQMHEIIEAATVFINQRLTEDLTVFTLAEQFHVARNYFSRLFKKEMGEGCNEYITRKRIEKAKHLLTVSRLKTYEVAEQVGYHDTNYFSLAFKKNTGLSPTEFRDRQNNPEI